MGRSPGPFPRGVPVSDSAVNRLCFRTGRANDDGMIFFGKKKSKAAEFVPVVLPDPIYPNAPVKKILVVDDDPIMVKTLSLTLSAKGYKVLTAVDGSQAIRIIRDE